MLPFLSNLIIYIHDLYKSINDYLYEKSKYKHSDKKIDLDNSVEIYTTGDWENYPHRQHLLQEKCESEITNIPIKEKALLKAYGAYLFVHYYGYLWHITKKQISKTYARNKNHEAFNKILFVHGEKNYIYFNVLSFTGKEIRLYIIDLNCTKNYWFRKEDINTRFINQMNKIKKEHNDDIKLIVGFDEIFIMAMKSDPVIKLWKPFPEKVTTTANDFTQLKFIGNVYPNTPMIVFNEFIHADKENDDDNGRRKVTFIEGFKPFIEVNENEIKLINPITGLNKRVGDIPLTWRTNEHSIFAIATMIKIYKQYAVL